LRFSENQADLKNIGAFKKTGGFEKYWRFYKNQADLENIGASQKNMRIYKMLASRRKIGGR
jgi:hypothetical protein